MSEGRLVTLSEAECLDLLRAEEVGRIGVVDAEGPIVLPVNYRCVEGEGGVFVAIRTRPGNVLDVAPQPVAFEIDGIDRAHRRGWSVLVRGRLRHLDPDALESHERFDSHPWVAAERDAWLVIEVRSISGRRLEAATVEWAFHATAYL